MWLKYDGSQRSALSPLRFKAGWMLLTGPQAVVKVMLLI